MEAVGPADDERQRLRGLQELGESLTLPLFALHAQGDILPGQSAPQGLRLPGQSALDLRRGGGLSQTLLREFRLKPEECFFIDDLSVNVEGARRAGLDGAVFFGDIPRLRRELIAAGVPCAPGEASL